MEMSNGPLKVFAPISHAKEDVVPGTVFLRPEEGDKTAFGQALFPVPTLDPNDPVLWPKWRKYVYLFCVIFFTLMGNSSCLTPSVFFVPWSEEFNVPVTQVTDVQNYAILVYGLVNLIWVPLSLKFGRRPTWLTALTIWWIFMALASTAQSYNALLTYSIVASLGSGICETVAVMAVDDIFFLHGSLLT
jgi:MFS family permease